MKQPRQLFETSATHTGLRDLRRRPKLNPWFNPAKTPRLRRGPRAACECDRPTCKQCRALASKRRWYRRNRQETMERTAANLIRWRAEQKTLSAAVTDAELDRRALAHWPQEWNDK